MSHFTVAVICDDFTDTKKLLIPYKDGDDCPKQYLVFNDKTEECETTYANGSTDEGELFRDKYASYEEFITRWFGYEFDEDKGAYGYWGNPNAKWDWYAIGGRWMGSLLIKEKNEGMIGESGSFGNVVPNTPNGYKWVDSCKISDVCWDKMCEISEFELLKDEPINGDIWDILIGPNDEKRMEYTYFNKEYFIERYGNKESYVKSMIMFSTYAVITPDGKWHAPGEMAMFGCSTESHDDSKEFEDKYFENFIEPNKDKIIVVVDCHT